jgi:hypothetical protein
VKLRIQDDSIRCRLGRRELSALVATGSLLSRTRFPGAVFTVTLQLGALEAPDGAAYRNGTIAVDVNPGAFRAWAEGNEESYAFTVDHADGQLSIRIEKDFPCDTRADCTATDDHFTSETLRLTS